MSGMVSEGGSAVATGLDPLAVAPDTASPPAAGPALAEPMPPEPPPAEPVPAEPTPAGPPRPAPLDAAGLDLLFREARTVWNWDGTEVTDETLRSLYDLLRMGPTSANCSPARFMFLRSSWAKERLRGTLSEGNVDKAIAAPVVCIVAHDPKFFEELPRLYPGADAREWFAGNEELAEETAFRNGTLQGAYLLLAARALGLQCGPMSGFDNAKVDSEFLVTQGWRSNFLVALGHADTGTLPPRAPRLSFDEACRLL